jgi:hypothetical protein
MPTPPSHLPGKGLFGWLGRQIGYVSGAIKAEPRAPEKPAAAPKSPPPPKSAAPNVVYRDDKVAEVPHPTQPGVTLRRTIIDEVVVENGDGGNTADPPGGGDRGAEPDSAGRPGGR